MNARPLEIIFKIYTILVYLGYILLKQTHQMTCGTINDLFMLFNISLKVLYFDNISLLSAVFTENRKYQ